MSDPKDGPSSLDGAGELTIIVKGGTTPGSYDAERARQRHASELGRAHQDKQMAAAAAGDLMTPDGFVSSRLHSLRLMDSAAPRVVYRYMNRDKTVRQEGVGEIAITPDDSVIVIMCPRCFERGESADNCQMQVRKSHRKWELDTKAEMSLVRLVDPFGKEFWVRIAGAIASDEILACTNFNCNYRVRVQPSKDHIYTEVYEV